MKLNILYTGWLTSGSTSLQRMNAFSRLGHQVTAINCNPFITKPYFVNRLLHRLFRIGLPVKRINLNSLNQQIVSISQKKKFDVLWIDKGLSIDRSTIILIKTSLPAIKICGYSPDVMSRRDNQSQRFLEHLNLYDHFFTTKSFDIENLKNLGLKTVSFVENSFDKTVHRPIKNNNPKFIGKVGFIGTYESNRENSILYLAQNGIPVTVYGGHKQGWSKSLKNHPKIKIFLHGHTHHHNIYDLRKKSLPLVLDSGSAAHNTIGKWNLINLEDSKCEISIYDWIKKDHMWKKTEDKIFHL